MSDLDLFDPVAFFQGKIQLLHQELTEKRTQAAILEANRRNLERTLLILAGLQPEQRRAIQMEIGALTEARGTTQRNLESIETEISLLLGKLEALRAAQILTEQEQGRPA